MNVRGTLFFILTFLVLWVQPLPARISKKGIPPLKQFTPEQYLHSGKAWAIQSAPNGMVYFATDKGLLEFDGLTWKRFKGSKGITRSILVLNDSTLYTGSDRDFGIWKRDIFGQFHYSSLYKFREELAATNEEFWTTGTQNGYIVFVSAANAYLYKDETITKIPVPEGSNGAFAAGNAVFLADRSHLYQLNGSQLAAVAKFSTPIASEIIGVHSFQGGYVAVTRNNGLLNSKNGVFETVSTPLSNELKKTGVFDVQSAFGSYRIFGTLNSGVVVADSSGSVVQHIQKANGLLNNTILSTHVDRQGTLWLGMDYGVAAVSLKDAFSFFYDFEGTSGTGYTAVLHNGVFYVGTNQGLYSTAWNRLGSSSATDVLRLIPGTDGQVWNLTVIDQTLWIGHDKGLFSWKNERLHRQSDQRGFWNLIPFKKYLLAGTYNGIAVFEKKGGSFSYSRQMDQIHGSVNQLFAEGDSILWLNIPNYGIVRYAPTDELAPARRMLFPPADFAGEDPVLWNQGDFFRVKTSESQYRWNPEKAGFEKDSTRQTEKAPATRLPGSFLPVDLGNGYEFHPVYNGFALKRTSAETPATCFSLPLVVRETVAFQNEGQRVVRPDETISHDFNAFRISVRVPNCDGVRYQFKVKDEDAWSEPSESGSYEWINLDHGVYVVSARAVATNDSVASEIRFVFHIAPPWYRTWYALTAALLITCTAGFLLFRRVSRYSREKEAAFLRHQQQSLQELDARHRTLMEEMEQRSLQEAYDLVKNQLRNKTMELARKARENEVKNALLDSVKEKFEQLKQHPESLKLRATEIQDLLDTYISQKDQTFEIQMNELHQDFFEKLKKHAPGLSPYDLKLCAYIKIGFNSKEIADLLSIQPSSVYITRSRLRKKLNLGTDDDLNGFLNSIMPS